MTLMKIRGIQKSYNERIVLKKAEFDIKTGSRIGLVGDNGAGKTTLANIIYGKLEPDEGTIETFNASVTIGYLKQSTEYTVHNLEHSDSLPDRELLMHSSQLGMKKLQEWDDERLEHLSGGEKLKLSLAKIWASRPELLILDEPTNHLDYQGMDWLIKELSTYKGAVIIISHDRYFLDQMAQEIIEIDEGITRCFKGNYSAYRQEKQRLYEVQKHHYETQQKHKQKIELQIDNLKNWSEKAHRDSTKQGTNSERRQIGYKEYHRVKAKKMDIQIRSKMKRLEQELTNNEVMQPKEETRVRFQFQSSKKRGKRILEGQNLGKSFGSRTLFRSSHFYMNHGERIALLGANGSGKTTLLKILLNEEKSTQGSLWISESVKIGYLSQDISDLPSSKTAIEYTGLTDRDSLGKAMTIFANIGLTEEKLTVPIETLSLGERTRIKLVMMLLSDLDLLILDEPTNHLDLASRESLEKTLMEFRGSILFVSHDVYFLNKMSEKLLIIEDGLITRKEMGYYEFKTYEPLLSSEKEKQEQLMIIQNEITALIGKLSFLTKEHPDYENLDCKLSELMKKKKFLSDE